MEFPEKFVRFDEFCPKCQFWTSNPGEDPCNDCLNHPVNLHSRVPTEFKEANRKKKSRM